ncbi:hypothetical protein Pyn_33248 [Prunus yedoensis var. nudiflora]|uniref:Uncharacterized protein n=1 Tax=Prunus yedoensis var. nudiflora TaxID=2094558 RepID=A0A314U8R2_PRUYE|nr:hypothetical protein Pyn_33248 [Prunus yedoensis var. nudiflora]
MKPDGWAGAIQAVLCCGRMELEDKTQSELWLVLAASFHGFFAVKSFQICWSVAVGFAKALRPNGNQDAADWDSGFLAAGVFGFL